MPPAFVPNALCAILTNASSSSSHGFIVGLSVGGNVGPCGVGACVGDVGDAVGEAVGADVGKANLVTASVEFAPCCHIFRS